MHRARLSLLYTDIQAFRREPLTMVCQPGTNKIVKLKCFKRWSFGFWKQNFLVDMTTLFYQPKLFWQIPTTFRMIPLTSKEALMANNSYSQAGESWHFWVWFCKKTINREISGNRHFWARPLTLYKPTLDQHTQDGAQIMSSATRMLLWPLQTRCLSLPCLGH